MSRDILSHERSLKPYSSWSERVKIPLDLARDHAQCTPPRFRRRLFEHASPRVPAARLDAGRPSTRVAVKRRARVQRRAIQFSSTNSCAPLWTQTARLSGRPDDVRELG